VNETVLDALAGALDEALAFDGNVIEAPVALLWPDKGRQWEPAVARLMARRAVVRLGDFAPDHHQGPAYWLRCVVAAIIELDDVPSGTPIVYLPGLTREDLRTLESAPPDTAPLAALQYRCQWFSHPNGRDWTIKGFFTNSEKGLGLSLSSDEATNQALAMSIGQLADLPMTRLQAKFIDADFLNSLLSPDPAGAILNWIDDPAAARSSLGETGWSAFAHQCRQDYGLDPDSEGEIAGARKLGEAEGPWADVWSRFRQSPDDYPGIPDRLRRAQPPELVPKNRGAWPGLVEEDENRLREALRRLAAMSPGDARARLLVLEHEHRDRRGYVWADLAWSPLALALEHLAEVARITDTTPPEGTVEAIVEWYGTSGWRADRAMLDALGQVERKLDIEVVEAALTAVYRPWAHETAAALQQSVGPTADDSTYAALQPPSAKGGAVLFVDGLRLDLANVLAERLKGAGLEVSVDFGLAALPTVTPTAKPATSLVPPSALGPGAALDARKLPDGPSAGASVLRSLMKENGVQVLGADELGDPSDMAWAEVGEIDRRGHDFGMSLAREVEFEIDRVARRVRELIDAGWPRVTIVTDHGWLLIPGGMRKADLPAPLAEVKKGRCARLKDGATTELPTVPWHWDRDVRIAVAPGITCFEAGKVYEHGGVSPQECVIPRVSVSAGELPAAGQAEITRARWHGLTLVVEFESLPDGATIDLRTEAGASSSSIATIARQTGGRGKVLLLVGDEDLEGTRAGLVVEASDGSLLYQRQMTVGVNT
jgi:hypothetical protein